MCFELLIRRVVAVLGEQVFQAARRLAEHDQAVLGTDVPTNGHGVDKPVAIVAIEELNLLERRVGTIHPPLFLNLLDDSVVGIIRDASILVHLVIKVSAPEQVAVGLGVLPPVIPLEVVDRVDDDMTERRLGVGSHKDVVVNFSVEHLLVDRPEDVGIASGVRHRTVSIGAVCTESPPLIGTGVEIASHALDHLGDLKDARLTILSDVMEPPPGSELSRLAADNRDRSAAVENEWFAREPYDILLADHQCMQLCACNVKLVGLCRVTLVGVVPQCVPTLTAVAISQELFSVGREVHTDFETARSATLAVTEIIAADTDSQPPGKPEAGFRLAHRQNVDGSSVDEDLRHLLTQGVVGLGEGRPSFGHRRLLAHVRVGDLVRLASPVRGPNESIDRLVLHALQGHIAPGELGGAAEQRAACEQQQDERPCRVTNSSHCSPFLV